MPRSTHCTEPVINAAVAADLDLDVAISVPWDGHLRVLSVRTSNRAKEVNADLLASKDPGIFAPERGAKAAAGAHDALRQRMMRQEQFEFIGHPAAPKAGRRRSRRRAA